MDEPAPRIRFGLRDLLIATAAVGVLLMLYMPWIQQARERQRINACQNRLKVLGLGIQTYESVAQAYPMNLGPSKPSRDDGLSFLTFLLPLIDEREVYDQVLAVTGGTDLTSVPLDLALKTPGRAGSGATPIPATIVKAFLCPSDLPSHRGQLAGRQGWQGNVPGVDAKTEFAVTNYKGVSGSNWGEEFAGDHTTDMVGMRVKVGPSMIPYRPPPRHVPDWQFMSVDVRYVGHDFGDGVFTRNAVARPNHTLTGHDITDGTSRTMAMGEVVPQWCDWSWWYGWNGSTATCGLPLNHRLDLDDRRATGFHDVLAEAGGFHSRHLHGGSFLMFDGSMHFFGDRMDWNVYRAIANYDSTAIGVP